MGRVSGSSRGFLEVTRNAFVRGCYGSLRLRQRGSGPMAAWCGDISGNQWKS